MRAAEQTAIDRLPLEIWRDILVKAIKQNKRELARLSATTKHLPFLVPAESRRMKFIREAKQDLRTLTTILTTQTTEHE